jgi:RecJ-like exonuclease
MVKICISHKEDPDGIVSACMIKYLYSTDVILADYSDFIQRIEEICNGNNNNIEHLFICDLGLSKSNRDRFVNLLSNIVQKGTIVTYIDHHYLDEECKRMLTDNGIRLMHTLDECTSMIIYSNLLMNLRPDDHRFAILAGCAAIIDELGNRRFASSIISRYDKHFMEFEATILAYAIYNNQHNQEYLLTLVNRLAGEDILPHAIEGVLDNAKVYAEKVSKNINNIAKGVKRIKNNIVYIQADDLSSSTIANMLLAMYGNDVKVTIAYKQRGDKIVISVRGSDLCKLHLGQIVNDIALSLKGSGGGHDKACGAMIPKEYLNQFIEKINTTLENYNMQ